MKLVEASKRKPFKLLDLLSPYPDPRINDYCQGILQHQVSTEFEFVCIVSLPSPATHHQALPPPSNPQSISTDLTTPSVTHQIYCKVLMSLSLDVDHENLR